MAVQDLLDKLRQLPGATVLVYDSERKRIKLQQWPITEEARMLKKEASDLGLYLYIENDRIMPPIEIRNDS